MSKLKKVAIVGVGLIGGSVGLALRERCLAENVTGIARKKVTLDNALAVGAIDTATSDLGKGVADADIVVVSTPVDFIAEHVLRVATVGKPRLITDAGSTKARICQEVDAQLAGISKNFIGSHPLAGDHRTGPENARADLFVGKTVVVTPTTTTSEEVLEIAKDFWQSLGAMVHVTSPEAHDQALAETSHLPHLVASAVARCTSQEYLPLTATGWADTTRVAAGDVELWTQIFGQNAESMVPAIDRLVEQLQTMRNQIAQGDWEKLQEILQQAKRIRDAVGN
jgi:prephenate dehydrogenase